MKGSKLDTRSGTVTKTAAETIAKGDLVYATDANYVYRVVPGRHTPLTYNHTNHMQPLSGAVTNTTFESTTARCWADLNYVQQVGSDNRHMSPRTAQFDDDKFVYVTWGNTGARSVMYANVNYTSNLAFANISSTIGVGSNTIFGSVYAFKNVTSSVVKHAFVYAAGATGNLHVCTTNATLGEVTTANLSVLHGGNTLMFSWSYDACVTNEDKFFVLSHKNSTNNIELDRFSLNATAMVTDGNTTVATGLTTGNNVSIVPASNGALCLWWDGTVNKAAKYNADGTGAFTNTTIYGNNFSAATSPKARHYATQLSNGNFAIVVRATSNIAGIAVINSTGGSVANIALTHPILANTVPALTALPFGGFAVVAGGNSGGTTYIATYHANGSANLALTLAESNTHATATDANTQIHAWARGNTVLAVRTNLATGNSTRSARMLTISATSGVLIDNRTVIQTTTPLYSNTGSALDVRIGYVETLLTKSNDLVYITSNVYSIFGYHGITSSVFKRVIAGVSQQAANSLESVAISQLGSYTLPANQTFTTFGAFDGTKGAPSGARGVIDRDTIVMEPALTQPKGKWLTRQIFNTPGAYAYAIPAGAGFTEMRAVVIGAGGGANVTFSGAGGGYTEKVYPASGGLVSVIVGANGYSNTLVGGTSSVTYMGHSISATGGGYGYAVANCGVGTGGDVNYAGGVGGQNSGVGGGSSGSPWGPGVGASGTGGSGWGGKGDTGGGGSRGRATGTTGGPGGPGGGEPPATTTIPPKPGGTLPWFDISEVGGTGGAGGDSSGYIYGAPGGDGAGGGGSTATNGQGAPGGLGGGGGGGVLPGGNEPGGPGGPGGGGGAGTAAQYGGAGFVILYFR